MPDQLRQRATFKALGDSGRVPPKVSKSAKPCIAKDATASAGCAGTSMGACVIACRATTVMRSGPKVFCPRVQVAAIGSEFNLLGCAFIDCQRLFRRAKPRRSNVDILGDPCPEKFKVYHHAFVVKNRCAGSM